MVDVHHHLLPGLDDGPPDLETSVQMAKMAVDDGITHIVCTPHLNRRFPFEAERIKLALTELRGRLASDAIPLELGIGCDFHLNQKNLQKVLSRPAAYTVNGGQYLMVELPEYGLSAQLGIALDRLQQVGVMPIITHPERNYTLQRDSTLVADLLAQGVLFQLTAGAVLGRWGDAAKDCAHRLLKALSVDVLATDAHNLNDRAPRLREAHEAVAKRYGASYADALCKENPMAIYRNIPKCNW